MSLRAAIRTRRRTLPLLLSCGAHALVFTLLWQLAPLGPQAQVDPEPISVRLVVHAEPPRPEPAFERVRETPRSELPAAPDFEPVPLDAPDDERELAALYDAEALPLAALPDERRSSAIGVGGAGLRRVPRPSAASALPLLLATPAALLAAAAAPRVELEQPASEALVPPVPLDCPAPEYPAGSASVGERGRVRLELRIDRDGRVSEVRLLGSSGFARLDESALSGVRRWRFRPAHRGEQTLEWRLEHTVVFRVLPAQG